MSMINVVNLTFAYDGSYDNIFENVSFQLDTNWKIGLVGRNGRGKTTFLRLLQGLYEYRGKISASVEFEYFPCKIENENQLAGDIVREIAPEAEDWEINRELSQLGIDSELLWHYFPTLSGGEKTKLLLGGLMLRPNNFLLLDEPTNHLDAESREKIGAYLSRKSSFILVSHDRELLDRCTNYTMSINKSTINVERGCFSVWYENKQRRDEFEMRENQRLKTQIKSLEKAAKKASHHADKIESEKIGFDPSKVEKSISRRAYISAKSKKLMKTSKSIETRIDSRISEKNELLHDVERNDSLKISPLDFFSKTLAAFDKISLFYGERKICSEITFEVKKGDRIAVCGENGCGKSTLLKLLCGEKIDYAGLTKRSDQLKISFVSQESGDICGSLSDYAKSFGIDEQLFRAVLSKMDFPAVQFFKGISAYSEGQKKKVMIARSLCEKAHLYVWDEPLNYIDIFSRIQIEELILKWQPTIVFVEHDSAFCTKIATKTVNLSKNNPNSS